MRILNSKPIELKESIGDGSSPQYSILSHTWELDESEILPERFFDTQYQSVLKSEESDTDGRSRHHYFDDDEEVATSIPFTSPCELASAGYTIRYRPENFDAAPTPQPLRTLHQGPTSTNFDYGYDLPCEFGLSGCHPQFHPEDFEQWIEHSISHFRGQLPVRSVCCFCDTEFDCSNNPNDARINWRRRMMHISRHFYQLHHNDTAILGNRESRCCDGMSRAPKRHNLRRYQRNSDAIHNFRRKLVFRGRGDWLVESEKFQKWVGSNSSSSFWLSGKPGSGKSVLASVVIDKLKSRSGFGNIVAFFCGDWRFRSSNIVVDLLKTILLQLQSRPTDSTSRSQLHALETDLNYVRDSISLSKMINILSTMRHNLKSHETLFVVIDGLEEASRPQQSPDPLLRQFLELITAQDSKHRIKCFITSRPGDFSESQFLGSLHMDIDDESAAQKDIATYVRNEIIGTPILKERFQVSVLDSGIEDLTSKANGNFLYSKLLLSHISTTGSCLPFSISPAGDLLETPKWSQLFGIYDKMLKASPADNRGRLYGFLGWVAHSARPLSLKELGCAIHYEVELTESIIRACSGGLLMTGYDETVGFVHWSVAEFLDSELSSQIGWDSNSDNWHEMIARECLLALPSSYLLQSLSLPSKFHDQQPLAGPHSSGILQYALLYWKYHYRLAEERSKKLPGILHNCLMIALEEEDLASRVKGQDVEISTMTSSISLNAKVANISLLFASRFGFPSLAKLELQMGADYHIVSERDTDGHSLLHLAVMGGNLDVATILVEYGAHPLVTSNSGHTALACAVYHGHYEIVEVFLSTATNRNPASSISSLSSTSYNIKTPNNDEYGWDCCTAAGMSANKRRCSGQHNCAYCLSGDHEVSYMTEIEIEATVSELCSDCAEMKVQYKVSNTTDVGSVPPFEPAIFSGGNIAKSELGLFEVFDTKSRGNTSLKTPIPRSQKVKWFLGVDINKALACAAKRGIEDVRRLLHVAGNDEQTISGITSITQLMSRLAIG